MFKKGHKLFKGTGRKSAYREFEFFDKLDRQLPEVIDYCAGLIKKAQRFEKKLDAQNISPVDYKVLLNDTKVWHELGLRAANILMSKAPDRVYQPPQELKYEELETRVAELEAARQAIRGRVIEIESTEVGNRIEARQEEVSVK